MNVPAASSAQTGFVPAGFLLAARISNMAVGLAIIPLLVHFLGGEGFAAWAVLLAAGAAFSALEVGMPLTFVKHAAPLLERQDFAAVDRLVAQCRLILVIAFAAALPVVALAAGALARLLQLPDGEMLTAPQMIVFVYGAVTLRALLQFGALRLNAGRRFRALATASFLQSLSANATAAVIACVTRRLDAALIGFWLMQLLAAAATGLASMRGRRGSVATGLSANPVGLRVLAAHGFRIQVYDWAQIINFQFDKFLIASFLGLGAVAPYEVANRSVLALRSVPSSGLDSFLATASIVRHSGVDLWPRFMSAMRMAATTVIVFMIAPLAVAPMFLYAWTGEMGYASRWPFVFLLLGAAANVLSLPAAAIVQAEGRTGIQARAAIASIVLNIPLSILLVLGWGVAGAAAGTAVAITASSLLLMSDAHAAFGKSLAHTLRELWQLWPPVLVCVLLGVALYAPFEYWLSNISPRVRFSWVTRAELALLAGALYLGCLVVMAAIQFHRGALPKRHYDLLAQRTRLKWFVAYCASRPRERAPGW